jgi:enoyl-CoA hydratase
MSVVKTEKHGAVTLVVIDRPDALNAINIDVLEGLEAAFEAIGSDPDVRAVVLAGEGKAFVAGADIAAMAALSPTEAAAFAARGQAVVGQISQLRVPVIAAVGGFALGGGCELAMACDLVLAGERARFGQPEVKLGVIPGFGGTQRLVRRTGIAVAMDLCLTGRMIRAAEAVSVGIASRVVEGDVRAAAIEVGQTIAKMGPVAVHYCKRAILDHADGPLDAGLAAERALFALCFATDDQREGMSAFLEKRGADFKGA